MKIYGIAFIKNGVKFDYPFKESLGSLLPLVDKIYINVGISDDGTLEEIKKFPKLEIVEVDWNDHRTDKGKILSDMTNIAINKMREEVKDENAWAFYLQSDEVIHEDDYKTILNDIQKANDEGCDVIKFRYLHFWQSHTKIAINKNWYPEEIRAFKVKSPIVSYGDAQSFEHYQKPYLSDAHIWHYGHVRDEKAYKAKMNRMSHYYHNGFDHYRKAIKNSIKALLFPEKTVSFYGRHPSIMFNRIQKIEGLPKLDKCNHLILIGNENDYSKKIIESINAEKVSFNTQRLNNEKLIKLSNLRKKSNSPNGREWANDFQLIIELSKHKIGLKSNS